MLPDSSTALIDFQVLVWYRSMKQENGAGTAISHQVVATVSQSPEIPGHPLSVKSHFLQKQKQCSDWEMQEASPGPIMHFFEKDQRPKVWVGTLEMSRLRMLQRIWRMSCLPWKFRALDLGGHRSSAQRLHKAASDSHRRCQTRVPCSRSPSPRRWPNPPASWNTLCWEIACLQETWTLSSIASWIDRRWRPPERLPFLAYLDWAAPHAFESSWRSDESWKQIQAWTFFRERTKELFAWDSALHAQWVYKAVWTESQANRDVTSGQHWRLLLQGRILRRPEIPRLHLLQQQLVLLAPPGRRGVPPRQFLL